MDLAIERRGEAYQKNEPALEIQEHKTKGPGQRPLRAVRIDP